MTLPTTTPVGSTNRLFYNGPIGVAGVGVTQDFDVSGMPNAALEDPTFADNWIVFARQVDAGITALSPDIAFVYANGKPTALRLTLDVANDTDAIDIEFWYIHSITR